VPKDPRTPMRKYRAYPTQCSPTRWSPTPLSRTQSKEQELEPQLRRPIRKIPRDKLADIPAIKDICI